MKDMIKLFPYGLFIISLLAFLKSAFSLTGSFGLAFGFIGISTSIIIALAFTVYKQSKVKWLIMLTMVVLGIITILPYHYWQEISENNYLKKNINQINKLYDLSNKMINVKSMVGYGIAARINNSNVNIKGDYVYFTINSGFQNIPIMKEFIKRDSIRLDFFEETSSLLKETNLPIFENSSNYLALEIGGMLDTRYGYIRFKTKYKSLDEIRKKIGRKGNYLRKITNEWYYYNTGS